MNCLVRLGDGSCEIWNGEQLQTADQAAIAALLNIPAKNVLLHQLYAGGSFGRRANPSADYLLEAVSIARAAWDKGVRVPIKLMWTREEDTRGGYYRPASYHKAKLALDDDGLSDKVKVYGVDLVLERRQYLVGDALRPVN